MPRLPNALAPSLALSQSNAIINKRVNTQSLLLLSDAGRKTEKFQLFIKLLKWFPSPRGGGTTSTPLFWGSSENGYERKDFMALSKRNVCFVLSVAVAVCVCIQGSSGILCSF